MKEQGGRDGQVRGERGRKEKEKEGLGSTGREHGILQEWKTGF